MKRRVFALLLALCLTLTVMPMSASAANLQPAVTDNHGNHDYHNNHDNWSQPIQSYLFENDLGGVTRVEYVKTAGGLTFNEEKDEWYDAEEEGYIIVEEYDDRFQLVKKVDIPMELNIWGGFFAGEDYNFFIYGRTNLEEKEHYEVIRVVKYSKDWKRLDDLCLKGGEIRIPFWDASLRCTEYGGMLYIRTSYQMFKDMYDINHQNGLMFSVRESDMRVTNFLGGGAYVDYGSTGHCFNQFIMVDSNNKLVAVDQGDATPRGIVLYQYARPAGEEIFIDTEDEVWEDGCVFYANIVRFALSPKHHYNLTGSQVGGLAETKSGYVVAYTYKDYDSNAGDFDYATSPAYLAYVSKGDIGPRMKPPITTRTISDSYCSNPVLVSTGLDGGYVLWEEVEFYEETLWGFWPVEKERRTFHYARYYGDGSLGPTQTADGALSDCQPIVRNGEVLWYTTNNSTPTFYILGENGLRAVFKDVPGDAYYYNAVEWAVKNGVTAGTGAGTFSPNASCTRGQIVTFLWHAAGSPTPSGTKNPFKDVKSSDYFYKAVLWAVENGITSGTSDTTFSPSSACTRAQAMTFLYRAKGSPSPSSTANEFKDVHSSDYYYNAVAWAVDNGITSGTSSTTFSPKQTCTRAQIVSFLYRAA